MRNFNIGDKIYSETTNTFHIVESFETIGGQDLVFTEDIKCFPSKYVTKSINNFKDWFEKISDGQLISETELDFFLEDIKNELNYKIELFDINIFSQTGIKIKPYQAY